MLRDALGPLVTFFAVWKLAGLIPGILAATGFAVLMYRHERRSGRPAVIVRLALALVFLRAAVGLISGSARTYLGQEVIIDVLLGSGVLGSVLFGRPIGEIFAREVYLFPEQVRESETYRETFRVISIVWGIYFFARAAVRAAALVAFNVDQFFVVLIVSDVPFIIGLLVWSVRYTVRRFRTSEEWAGALALAEAEAAAAARGG